VKRLGVIGTIVWDTIYGRGEEPHPVEEWGGIAYALAALEATLPDDWVFVPLVKVGRDMAGPASTFLRELGKGAGAARFVEVPEPNNRVLLRYQSWERRSELLTGGVPGWRWAELGPMVRDLDALYVNFISGFELDLETALALRRAFPGPIYADLHSLFLDLGADGLRTPRALPDADAWFSCFDVIQLNESEMARLGPDPMAVAARALGAGVGLLAVTLGPRGTVYFTTSGFTLTRASTSATGPVRTARVPAPAALDQGDPTGCGDVFGATLLAHLIRGYPVEEAIAQANYYAARNVSARGATRLQYYLRGAIVPA
jgi:sugar/nucleoside kinase (ribokinase family)